MKLEQRFSVCRMFSESSCRSCFLGCPLLDRLYEEDVVLHIRTESRLNISIIRIMSESPMNAVTVNQDVLSAWGT